MKKTLKHEERSDKTNVKVRKINAHVSLHFFFNHILLILADSLIDLYCKSIITHALHIELSL